MLLCLLKAMLAPLPTAPLSPALLAPPAAHPARHATPQDPANIPYWQNILNAEVASLEDEYDTLLYGGVSASQVSSEGQARWGLGLVSVCWGRARECEPRLPGQRQLLPRLPAIAGPYGTYMLSTHTASGWVVQHQRALTPAARRPFLI